MPLPTQSESGFVAFLLRWHGIWRRRAGRDGLRRTLRQLQGVSMPFSDLESSILQARVSDYSPMLLDELIETGEFVWQGDQVLGQRDGYITVYDRSEFPRLGRISVFADGVREQQIRSLLLQDDGLDFDRIMNNLGGFSDDILRSLWQLVWCGEVSSNSLDALRARLSSTASRFHRRPRPRYTTRERLLPGASGRWSLLSGPRSGFAAQAERELAWAGQLLDRCGILCRRTAADFDELQPLLERLEAQGMALRTQLLEPGNDDEFAAPGVEQIWRASRDEDAHVVLSACDPANPFGILVPWPELMNAYRPLRSRGARVLIDGGRLVGYMTRTGRHVHTPVDLTDPAPLMRLLRQTAVGRPVYLETVNGDPPYETPLHDALVDAGFSPSRRGYLLRAVG